jgi:hypothetical protein
MEFKYSRIQLLYVFIAISVGVFVSIFGSNAAELQNHLGQVIPLQLIPVFSTSKAPPAEGYEVQIFSREPLILYVYNFVSTDEIKHLLAIR